MVEANSLLYLISSLLTLTSHDPPTTDPSLRAWETTSEPSFTDSWHQKSYRYTERYNDEHCPTGEEYSVCDANCQKTCKNVEKQEVCPQTCVPGCVCSPGTVRDSDGKCVHPPLCKRTHEEPVTRYHDRDTRPPYSDDDYEDYTFGTLEIDPDDSHWSRVTKPDDEIRRVDLDPLNPDKLNSGDCPDVFACSKSCKKKGNKRGGTCVGIKNQTCRCIKTSTTYPSRVDPDEVDPYTRFPNVDPDEITPATKDPRYRVDPDEVDPVTRDPRNRDRLIYRGCASSDCDKKCQQDGFKMGVCTGIFKENCICKKSPTKPFTDNPDEVEITTNFERVDPDEVDPVTRDPRNRDKLNSGPCIDPDTCNRGCKKVGFKAGLCYGPKHDVCQCYNMAPKPYTTEDPDKLAPYTRIPRVDPDEIDHTDEYPRYTFNPDERDRAERDPESINPDERDRAERDPESNVLSDQGCPKDSVKCFKYCQGRGRQWGYCLYRAKTWKCNCTKK